MSVISDYQKKLKKAGLYHGEIDGDFGPLTLLAAQEFHCGPNKVPRWMLIAGQELGVSEIYGGRDNPRIVMYHGSTSLGGSPDEVAWCSSFVNWCMETAGRTGTNSAAARSWDSWGTRMRAPLFGAVHTVPRTGGSGRHVFFNAGYTDTHVFGLGGNQSDKVNIVPYRRAILTATRWPFTQV